MDRSKELASSRAERNAEEKAKKQLALRFFALRKNAKFLRKQKKKEVRVQRNKD
jgi:hypothetical protein